MRKAITERRGAELMREGAVLVRVVTRDRVAGCAWYLLGFGEIGDSVAIALIERKDVYGQPDGLFPNTSQTFRIGHAP
jgi:hypothetical protein